VSNQDLGRDAHWFDGDGMLSGVAFQRSYGNDSPRPYFVNQYVLTDCLIASVTSPTLKTPILPSIATLVNPGTSIIRIIFAVLRTIFLVILSHITGSWQPIKKISVANTNVVYHDGRALATCESGPPIRIQLPGLETVGWFNGNHAEGERHPKSDHPRFGGEGIIGFMKEWTTGHPKVDPLTKEMILFHCTFSAPYVHYSILPATRTKVHSMPKLLNAPVLGVTGGKMMHDFGVSRLHSIIMDLPLSLDPLNLIKGRAVLSYNSSKPARFGVFPRRNPAAVRWFETFACCIFHTANSWDELDSTGTSKAVNMLACRLTSAALVYSAGNIVVPRRSQETIHHREKAISFFAKYDHDEPHAFDDPDEQTSSPDASYYDSAPLLESEKQDKFKDPYLEIEEDQCRLYYYRFSLYPDSNIITHQFALSAIPFEFPTLHPEKEMTSARYIYGCSTSTASFGSALGRAVKIDVIAKINVLSLIEEAQRRPPRSITGCVDERSVIDILTSNVIDDPIQCFKMPKGWYAQEARFVPRMKSSKSNIDNAEDDGYLLFYAFDEAQLDEEGEVPDSAISELWILDAKTMMDVVCRIKLPQRVPYGLHGNWFSEDQIRDQRDVEKFRQIPDVNSKGKGLWLWMRDSLIASVG
jgi:carotenoid cleavage dioxygenase-like enzyme